MEKLDRLAIMASILCVANEASKKGAGVSDYDLTQAADQAILLEDRVRTRLAKFEQDQREDRLESQPQGGVQLDAP